MTAIHLEENYRSSGAILLSALEVIQQDSSRPKKPLLPTHTVGTMPVLRKLSSAACEARWVVSEIKRLIAVTGNMLSFSDFAILIRSGPLSRQIESALGKSSVPYVYVGGHKFFDRHEIKVVLGYLRTISQPDNSDALVRILNVPPRRIGEATIQRLLEAAESQQTTLWSLIKESLSGKRQFPLRVTKVARSGFSSLQALIEKAQSRFLGREADGVQLTNMLLFLIKELSLKEYLVKTYPDDHETRWANVEELVAMASDVSQTASSNGRRDASPILPDASGEDGITTTADALSELLTNIALSAGSLQRDGETTQPKVMLSTIHAAKGLEWPVVFVVGAYDGSIPHSRAENHDEERRLLYVAMTRAQALLYVSVPANNSMQGPTTTSPFLSHHAVKKHLATKGPSISYDALQSVASILGRVCPSEANIRIACRDLESREDDVWPINGTSTFLNGDGFETYEDADCSLALYRDAKRRCTGQQNHSAIWGPSKADSNGNGRLSTLAGHSKFSVPSTTMHIGFVSAASHLSKLDEYCSARVAAGLAGQPSSHKAKISSVTALQHPTSATTIRLSYHKPGGEETVQGSPACFSAWKKLPKDAKDLEEKEKNKESRPPCSSFRVPRALEFVAPEDIVNSTAAGWHPSVHTEDDLATAMMPQSVARANALSMSDRRVRNAPVSLPRLEGCSNIGSGEKENPYVFLSSPTSDDSVATKASRPLRDISANSSPSRHSISKLSESQARVSSSTKNAEAVNSKFIHPTKRTLGMRRSINGWK
ncbi:MAG: hypothetical protein M1833_005670 [Piccolia ochrophora]|nr:MAG: hypothetical protein M1833_005670 [Piccolia ochrophora]